jgi:hypothetical protein
MARLTIDDNTLAPLEGFVTEKRTLDALVTQSIKRVAHIPPNARFVILDERMLNALEQRLGTVIISKPEELYNAVDQLADIKLGNTSFQFTPAQYRELMERASREACTPEQLAARIIQTMIPQFFTMAPADPPVLVGKGR